MSHIVDRESARGSALLIAVFVLVLVAGTGVALLFLARTESKMGLADQDAKKAFYLAEAGLEDGRATLFNVNGKEEFSDDLLTAAGGTANDIDFDPTLVSSVYDTDGTFTGFTGYDDDVPLRDPTQIQDGWYAAFLTNDYDETLGRADTTDTNQRVMLTAVGVVPGKSEEIVEAVIRKRTLFPSVPPATITMVGPNPEFLSGNSNVKEYIGDDCPPSTLYVPVVGVIGSDAELAAEAGMEGNPDFVSGTYEREDVFADLTDLSEPTNNQPIDPSWTDCEALQEFIEDAVEIADNKCQGIVQCGQTTPCGDCHPSNTTASSVTIVDGDYQVSGNLSGQGLLIVTGLAEFGGNVDWDGLIFVVGDGTFRVAGAGNGTVTGGLFLADIAGPDGVYGNVCTGTGARCFASGDCPAGQSCRPSDDNCTGGDDGFGQATYDESGGGNSGTHYCSTVLEDANPGRPYDIISFLQR